jgi:hypothetical protein
MAVSFRVFSFLFTSTTSGTSNTSVVKLEVVGQPTLTGGSNTVYIYVTFKNDGTSPVNLVGSTIIVYDKNNRPVRFDFYSGPTTLSPGSSDNFVYLAGNTDINNMPNVATATLHTIDGYQLSFQVFKQIFIMV